jgi:hypothetical protein
MTCKYHDLSLLLSTLLAMYSFFKVRYYLAVARHALGANHFDEIRG